jgi:hypothetical protein
MGLSRSNSQRVDQKIRRTVQEKGCDHMTTHTDAENMAARALYASVGMHEATVEFGKNCKINR